MRPVRVSVNAAGTSQWIPVDYLQVAFGIGLGVIPSEDAATVSYTVQHTFDSMVSPTRQVSWTRVTTTMTVTDTGPAGLGHGLSTGDSVILKGSGTASLDSPMAAIGMGDLGWTVASTPSSITYTVTVTNAGPAAGVAVATNLRVFDHSTLAAASTRQDGYYAFPPTAVRLKLSTLAAGFVDLYLIQGMGH